MGHENERIVSDSSRNGNLELNKRRFRAPSHYIDQVSACLSHWSGPPVFKHGSIRRLLAVSRPRRFQPAPVHRATLVPAAFRPKQDSRRGNCRSGRRPIRAAYSRAARAGAARTLRQFQAAFPGIDWIPVATNPANRC